MFEFAVSSNWSLLRVAHSGLYGFPPFTRAESSKFYDDFDRGDKYPYRGFAASNFICTFLDSKLVQVFVLCSDAASNSVTGFFFLVFSNKSFICQPNEVYASRICQSPIFS